MMIQSGRTQARIKICAFFALLLTSLLFTTAANAYDLVPMWQAYYGTGGNDSFYTEDFTQRALAIDIHGYVERGVAFWMPCSSPNALGPNGLPPDPTTINSNLGYTNLPMNYACAKPAGALPFWRFWAGAPFTEHFYTTSVSEANTLLASPYNYHFERVEGYVFTSQQTGTVPLYRLAHCIPVAGGCDLEHRYTISTAANNALINAGWGSDGVVGYVFNGFNNSNEYPSFTGTINGSVSPTSSPVSIQNVPVPSGTLSLHGQGRGITYGYVASNSTPRPAGADRQSISLTLNTGSLFSPGTNLDHIPVQLYHEEQFGSDGLASVPYDGIGIFFSLPQADNNLCSSSYTTGAQIFVELYGSQIVDCSTNLATPMAENHSYKVTLTVTDGATLTLQVIDLATNAPLQFASGGTTLTKSYNSTAYYPCPFVITTLTAPQSYCGNPYTRNHFPLSNTGYAIWPIFTTSSSSAAGAISSLQVSWQNSAGALIWHSP